MTDPLTDRVSAPPLDLEPIKARIAPGGYSRTHQWQHRQDIAALIAEVERLQAEHVRTVLRYTAKGYKAGENANAKYWRERAEVAEAEISALRAALPSARVWELAREAARHRHFQAVGSPSRAGHVWIGGGEQCQGFSTCPHPDCVAVRACANDGER